jgi:hypothetical protein
MVQPPSSKITASMVAGALTVIIVAEAQRRGYPIDGTEGASISVVLSAIAGYLIPHSQAQAPGSPAAKEAAWTELGYRTLAPQGTPPVVQHSAPLPPLSPVVVNPQAPPSHP